MWLIVQLFGIGAISCTLTIAIIQYFIGETNNNNATPFFSRNRVLPPVRLALNTTGGTKRQFRLPKKLSLKASAKRAIVNTGGLTLSLLKETEKARIINDDDYDKRSAFDRDEIKGINNDDFHDGIQWSWGFHDDEYQRYPPWDNDNEQQCRRPNWYRDLLVNCNAFHESDLSTAVRKGTAKYAGAGDYRTVYVMDLGESVGSVAYKDYSLESHYENADFENIRVDALISERFSWSPLIIDIYGLCGTTSFSEPMPYGDMDYMAVPIGGGGGGGRVHVESISDIDENKVNDDVYILYDAEGVDPQNNFTGTQKLQYALDMAEAVALLHGFEDGVIVHGDVWLAQFLLSADGRIKLNDFNLAQIMFWSERDQEYCRYRNGPGAAGDWRPPEEWKDEPLNEKIDVWCLGFNMYALLTGLYPFYDTLDIKKEHRRINKGETPYIDPRYSEVGFAEQKLVEIMQKCWGYTADERMDVFELVRLLRQAVNENEKREKNYH